MPTRG